jgi:DNA ligase-1
MSVQGRPTFSYHVFDNFSLEGTFAERVACLPAYTQPGGPITIVPQVWVDSPATLLGLEQHWLEQGYEGVILRDPQGKYKHGRSTLKEAGLLKLKRFTDGEAEVIGFEELMHNENAAKTDALGHTERSTSKAGLRPAGTLGALLVRDLATGVEFSIGTGLSASDRDTIWADRGALLGRLVKYKAFNIGAYDAPRFPVFLGFRDRRDM